MSWPLHQIVLHKYGDGEGWHGYLRSSKTQRKYTHYWYVDRVTGEAPVPGDVFFFRRYRSKPPGVPQPRLVREHRLPIVVVLPNGVWFSPDFIYDGDTGWEVSNISKYNCKWDLEHMTVHPSINVVGSYHGWIKDGVLSDDLEGRKY